MAPKLLRIAIIHVLLWNIIFSLSESIDLNEDRKLLLNRLRDRVRYTTHICDRLKNSSPVINHNNYEPLPDSYGVDNVENLGLAKDLSEPSNTVKRHAILRCYNHPAQENNEPNRPDLISSEWQMKSTPVNDAHGDLYDHSMVQKSKVVGLKKIDINSQKVIDQKPLYHTLPFLQKGNLIGNNPKHSLLQLNLQDTKNKIKSLISPPQHKLGEIISDKLVDESLHNKLAQPSLPFPLPSKFIKYPVINPTEVHPTKILTNVNTAGLTTDSDKQSNPLKLSPLLPAHIPNNNFYHKDLTVENKPFLSLPQIQIKPKPVDILYDRRVPPIVYRPTLPQFIQTPVIKPTLPPILVQTEVSIPSTNEQPQANIGLTSQYPKIIKNGIPESTSQSILFEKDNSISLPYIKQQELIGSLPTKFIKTSGIETFKPITLIEKKVSIYLPHKKQQEFINLSPPTQFMKTSDTKTVHEPITIENEAKISAPKEQKQPIDLPPQAPQLNNTPDKESSIYQETPGKTIESVNVPYEQKQSIISLSSPPQITEPFYSESTSQIIPSENEVSMSSAYGQQLQAIATFSPPPQQMVIAPLNLVKTINTESISQKKNSLYDQQKPIILPSPPPLTKTTTSAYAS